MTAIIDIERGCLDIWIDSLVFCLKDTETGEMKDTVVFKIESRSYLKKFRENNGWHINLEQNTPKCGSIRSCAP